MDGATAKKKCTSQYASDTGKEQQNARVTQPSCWRVRLSPSALSVVRAAMQHQQHQPFQSTGSLVLSPRIIVANNKLDHTRIQGVPKPLALVFNTQLNAGEPVSASSKPLWSGTYIAFAELKDETQKKQASISSASNAAVALKRPSLARAKLQGPRYLLHPRLCGILGTLDRTKEAITSLCLTVRPRFVKDVIQWTKLNESLGLKVLVESVGVTKSQTEKVLDTSFGEKLTGSSTDNLSVQIHNRRSKGHGPRYFPSSYSILRLQPMDVKKLAAVKRVAACRGVLRYAETTPNVVKKDNIKEFEILLDQLTNGTRASKAPKTVKHQTREQRASEFTTITIEEDVEAEEEDKNIAKVDLSQGFAAEYVKKHQEYMRLHEIIMKARTPELIRNIISVRKRLAACVPGSTEETKAILEFEKLMELNNGEEVVRHHETFFTLHYELSAMRAKFNKIECNGALGIKTDDDDDEIEDQNYESTANEYSSEEDEDEEEDEEE